MTNKDGFGSKWQHVSKKMLNKILPRQQNEVKLLQLFFKNLAKISPIKQNNGQKYFYFSHLCEILHTEKRLVFMYFTPLLFGDLIVHICIPSSLFLKFLQLLRFPAQLILLSSMILNVHIVWHFGLLH
jgi:hypothetical protein